MSTLVSLNTKYKNGYWFFEFFHFLGGFFVAMLFSNFVQSWLAILSATIAAGVFWEILEFIVDKNPRLKALLRQETITLTDTALDLFLDASGGIVFLLFNYFWR